MEISADMARAADAAARLSLPLPRSAKVNSGSFLQLLAAYNVPLVVGTLPGAKRKHLICGRIGCETLVCHIALAEALRARVEKQGCLATISREYCTAVCRDFATG